MIGNYGRKGEWVDRWMCRQMNGWMNTWMDGWESSRLIMRKEMDIERVINCMRHCCVQLRKTIQYKTRIQCHHYKYKIVQTLVK